MRLAKQIRVLELRNSILAKIDYKGSFQGIGKTYDTLLNWANANGFNNPKKNKTITLYYDDPNIVGVNNVRQSACIITDASIKPTDHIREVSFQPGKCAVGRFEVSYFKFKFAWTEMYEWVNRHNLKASNNPPFEVYQNNSNSHPQKKCIIDICVPLV